MTYVTLKWAKLEMLPLQKNTKSAKMILQLPVIQSSFISQSTFFFSFAY